MCWSVRRLCFGGDTARTQVAVEDSGLAGSPTLGGSKGSLLLVLLPRPLLYSVTSTIQGLFLN